MCFMLRYINVHAPILNLGSVTVSNVPQHDMYSYEGSCYSLMMFGEIVKKNATTLNNQICTGYF